ncbi:hypothetical protein FEM03_21565 [Phragmitibacter flavus]|uniref:PA14 domain-containing protein n=2 Tax=Phragmitibacter flavus TaxID=2576071 RepID=A0A5R8K8K8_9BACT|nr:hypothetical protein FEM03_21565 [Phragmitibacter flavus]
MDEVSAAGKKDHVFVSYWRKAGGGSLSVSIALHVALLVAAYFIVDTISPPEAKVDFVPGGGSKAAAQASQERTHQVQQKKFNKMQQSMPMKRIVVESSSATISLPDLPLEDIDLPDTSSMMGGAMGGGGFGSAGVGLGSGNGIGSGAMKGFAGMTFFGKIGGDGIPGSFYDLKQDRKRQPLTYGRGNQAETFREYAGHINKVAARRFGASVLDGYYKASQEVNFTYLLVPTDTLATEGPKCFGAEKEVQPSGWFVHYTGNVVAPDNGEWRFVGFFDDLLIVYINGKPVLDGSWNPMVERSGRNGDVDDIRQEFRGPSIAGDRTAYVGRWIKFSGSTRIDIVVGETPGGKVGGLLMVEKKGATYERRADGTPILPLFSAVALDAGEKKGLMENAFAKRVQVDPNMPVFEVKKSVFR